MRKKTAVSNLDGTILNLRTLQVMEIVNMPLDEGAAWSRAISGDPDSFGVIYDLNRDRVFRHAFRLVGSIQDAEDVSALVFLEMWRSRTRVRVVDGSTIGWLLATTNNVVSNYRRALRRHRTAMAKIPVSSAQADHSDSVLENLDRLPERTRVRAAFDQLQQSDQEVLVLCVLEQLTSRQAGIALRIPEGTVKSRLSRAKYKLASALDVSSVEFDSLVEGGTR